MKKRLISMIMALVLTATFVTGCGSDKSSSSETASSIETSVQGTESSEGAGSIAGSQGNSMTVELVGTASDYSNKDNWLAIPEITKKADTIYFYPTAYNDASEGAKDICDIDNKAVREEAQRLYARQAVAFEDATNVFAPYYRQSNIFAVMEHADDPESFQKNEQRTDVYAALDYYFENYNDGRPFILAGHSQGSMMIRLVLDEYFSMHPELADQMIAAYAIGESFPKDWLDKHTYVKFAEGADDTGVIVSWNTEGPGNKNANNFVVEKGAVSINPINWKRDDTYAPAKDNLGSRSLDENGEYVITPGLNDAQVNTERGVVICTTSSQFVPLSNLFGEESLHGVDFDLYFENIRQNVKVRVDAYLKNHNEVTTVRAVDMEHHYYVQEFLDIAEKRDSVPRYNSETKEIEYVDGVWMGLGPIIDKLLALDDSRIEEMDACGVSAAMLEISPGVEVIKGEKGIQLCRLCNDIVYEAMQKYPGRFYGSATLPLGEIDAAVEELERCVNEYGFVSWHTHSNYGDTHIDDEQYRPILEKCAELGAYVYIHPSMPDYDRINELGV